MHIHQAMCDCDRLYLMWKQWSYLHGGTTNTCSQWHILRGVQFPLMFMVYGSIHHKNVVMIETDIVFKQFFILIVEIIIHVFMSCDKSEILLKIISISASSIIDFINKLYSYAYYSDYIFIYRYTKYFPSER